MRHQPKPAMTPERFWERVDRRGEEECWPWLGAVTPNGYGVQGYRMRSTTAHRIAYELANGCRVTRGMHVRHRCDNRLCCNPAHLEVGTAAENTRDRMERGVVLRGIRNPSTKLGDADAEKIRALAAGGMLQREIGALFGVTQSCVSLVLLRKGRWA